MVNTGWRVVAVDSSPQELILYNVFHIPRPCQHYWFPITGASNRELFILDFMELKPVLKTKKFPTSLVLRHNLTSRHFLSSSYPSNKGTFEQVSPPTLTHCQQWCHTSQIFQMWDTHVVSSRSGSFLGPASSECTAATAAEDKPRSWTPHTF